MFRTVLRRAGILLAMGYGLAFGGCLFRPEVARDVVVQGVIHEGFEFLLDNDAVLDIFPDS